MKNFFNAGNFFMKRKCKKYWLAGQNIVKCFGKIKWPYSQKSLKGDWCEKTSQKRGDYTGGEKTDNWKRL